MKIYRVYIYLFIGIMCIQCTPQRNSSKHASLSSEPSQEVSEIDMLNGKFGNYKGYLESTPLKIKPLTVGDFYRINSLSYKYGDSELTNNYEQSSLKKLKQFLKKHSKVCILIASHTDALAPTDFCDKLSQNRAKGIATYLIESGVGATQIQCKGFGKRIPIATNHTKEGRALNERIEIVIMKLSNQ